MSQKKTNAEMSNRNTMRTVFSWSKRNTIIIIITRIKIEPKKNAIHEKSQTTRKKIE